MDAKIYNFGTGNVTQPDKYTKYDSSTGSYATRNSDSHDDGIAGMIEGIVNSTIQIPFNEPKAVIAKGLETVAYSAAQEKPYTLKEAKGKFEKYFFETKLRDNYGNIAQVARVTGVNRRTIHRKVNELGLAEVVDGYRPQKEQEKVDSVRESKSLFSEDVVANTIKETISGFKDSLHPQVYTKIETGIDTLAKEMTTKLNNQNYGITNEERINTIYDNIQTSNLKDAEKEFEKNFVYSTWEAAGFDKKKTADYLDIDVRSLNRKISDFGLNENNNTNNNANNNPNNVDNTLAQYYASKEEEKENADSNLTSAEKLDTPQNDTYTDKDSENLADVVDLTKIKKQKDDKEKIKDNDKMSDLDRLKTLLSKAA
ncbi:hypothetical protein HOK51_00660 [Candidatus Woesearchaeota archaeon]|jgi:hypothetical protein|nr:hypothetical protein [Candidatus Woesearchaeota archaeon]MBT6518325.1 hypothetical protein [Candidatus Woesearchaeota archaeon]MBT7366622.1 hypothetical protein [Candidatus Woesearchaeota archaeon]